MKRNTKRFASLLLAAAMAFGLSTAAFAEQATPEAALYAAEEVVPLSDAIAKDADGNTYTSLQAAIDANKGTVTLLTDTAEVVELSENASATIDFNGHTLTAAEGSYVIKNAGSLNLQDSSADKKGGTRSEILNLGGLGIQSGTYTTAEGNVIDNCGTATLYGGTYSGAANQPVFYSYPGEANKNMLSIGITFIAVDVTAGEGGTIIGCRSDITECYYTFGNGGHFYGELGMSDPKMVLLLGGSFDHEVSADCLSTMDGKEREIVKDGDFWTVVEKKVEPAAVVTSDDGFNRSYNTLAEAARNAVMQSEVDSGKMYTVKLLRDVTENVILSKISQDPNLANVTIQLDGHTLTAKNTAAAAISVTDVYASIDDGGDTVRGTVNGRVEANVSFDLYETTINAPAGQPALVCTATGESSIFDMGRGTVINGAAGQPTILTSARYTSLNLGAEIHAGEGGYIFERYDGAEDVMFQLGECKLYGDLAYGDTLKKITCYFSYGKSDAAFDREPGFTIEGYPLTKGEDGLYRFAMSINVDGDKQEVKSDVNTGDTELPAVPEDVPADKQPTQAEAAAKAEELLNELTGANDAVQNFTDNNLTNTVRVNELKGVAPNSTVQLYVQAVLKDIQLGTTVAKDTEGNVEVKLSGKTLVFDVTPMAKVDGNDAVAIANNLLNGNSVVFRLPIPAEVTEKYAEVLHEGDAKPFYVEIKTENGKKYIELSATHFSLFTVNFTNELPVEPVDPVKPAEPAQPAAPAQNDTAPAQSSAATTAPAAKQDDSAYYTCKACGYHDWTAVDGGYKCSHCGYVESVKQLAGYRNVKGTAQVGKTAAAKTSAKALSAIPQTSDDMPVAALMILAAAALLGLCVTAAAKRKHSK